MRITVTAPWVRGVCAALFIIGVGALTSGDSTRDRLQYVALAAGVALIVLALGYAVVRAIRRPPDRT